MNIHIIMSLSSVAKDTCRLTDEQQYIFDTIINHIKKGVLSINAPAGTGKTHLITYLYHDIKDKLIILAPTHKACTVINSKLGKKQICQTIHRFLNSTQEINEETGEITFVMQCRNIIDSIIIIDESSMINKDMFEKFIELSINNLVIFIGDAYQIPPVKEDKSLVFSLENQLTLTKNMRSTKSLSNHYLQKFRNGVEKSITTKINFEDKKNTNFVRNEYKKKKDIIILAWTNAKVKYWNNLIREHKFYDKLNELDELNKYYKDELLVFSGYRPISKELTYYSNDIIQIMNLSKINLEIEFPSCEHMLKGTNLDNLKKCPELQKKGCSLCDIKSHRNTFKIIEFYEIIDNNNVVWHKSVSEDNKEIKVILLEYKYKALKLKNKKTWGEYYQMVYKYDPELNYSYSSTVHKAQGSAWETVIVDINNIRFNKNMSDNTRLAYTAVSRMSDTVYFTT